MVNSTTAQAHILNQMFGNPCLSSPLSENKVNFERHACLTKKGSQVIQKQRPKLNVPAWAGGQGAGGRPRDLIIQIPCAPIPHPPVVGNHFRHDDI